jgi:four helix bundle protein
MLKKDSSYYFPFEKLQAWQDAKKLVIDIYAITKEFPGDEKFGLTSQINRAAVSVASNLAEGSSRMSMKDQAYFSQLAFSSLMELACQIAIAEELNFINAERYDSLRRNIEVLSKKLNALRHSQIKRAAK